MKRFLPMIRLTSVLIIVLTGCAPAETPMPTEPSNPPIEITSSTSAPEPFELTSSAFEVDMPIPARYSCHGENLSPPLDWSRPPSGTQSLVLIMEDPDAMQVVGHVWDHWLLFNIPAGTLSLPEDVSPTAELTDGSQHGRNSSIGLGYGGPCPPNGQTHRYVFTLYAVDLELELPSGVTKDEILQAMDGHILAQTELSGLYTSP